MTSESDGIGRALSGGLRLSSNAAFEREKAAEVERAEYRRQYWQKYSKRVRRVFGTVTPEEYATIAARAEVAQGGEPSVWRQIWLESRAYVSGAVLPTVGKRRLIALVDLQNPFVREGVSRSQEMTDGWNSTKLRNFSQCRRRICWPY